MKGNLLLLKDSVELQRKNFINTQLQYRKMCILINQTIQLINTTIHITAQKPVHVKPSIYIYSSKEINGEDPKFKMSDIVRISKYKNIFGKVYVRNWSEEVFVIKKAKNTVPWLFVIIDLKDEEIVGMFYEKELRKTNQKEFRVEKVIQRKENKLYVKWKGFDSSFNSRIEKKDIV